LDIPDSYKANNGDFIIWERRWRESGLHSDQYYGIRISPKRRGAVDRIKVEIKGRSNIHALLRQIEFEYVPAVKDASYFDQLRGRIYRTIAEVASKSFVESSSSFEKSIADHLSSLSAEILDSLRIKTRLALPKDLTPIFQRLDFLGGEKSISLDSRGDGIKVRHIPLILKFISEKNDLYSGREPHLIVLFGLTRSQRIILSLEMQLSWLLNFRHFLRMSRKYYLLHTHRFFMI